MKRHLLCILLFLPLVSRAAEVAAPLTLVAPVSDSMEAVFNSFIATFAKEQVDWRKDLEMTATPAMIPAGRQLGVSSHIGYFTYLPRTWDDFTVEERAALTRHPKFRSFLISLRNSNTYPSVGVASSMTQMDRRDPSLNPDSPVYPVDGIPVSGRGPVSRVVTTAPTAVPVVPAKHAKHKMEITIEPEQMVSKKDLIVQIF